MSLLSNQKKSTGKNQNFRKFQEYLNNDWNHIWTKYLKKTRNEEVTTTMVETWHNENTSYSAWILRYE